METEKTHKLTRTKIKSTSYLEVKCGISSASKLGHKLTHF